MYLDIVAKGNFYSRLRILAKGMAKAETVNKYIVVYWPPEEEFQFQFDQIFIPNSISRLIGYTNKHFNRYIEKEDYSDKYIRIRKETLGTMYKQIRIRNEIQEAADVMYKKMNCKTDWPVACIDNIVEAEEIERTIPKVSNGNFWLSTEIPEVKERLRDYYGGACVIGPDTNPKTPEGQMYGIVEWELMQRFTSVIGGQRAKEVSMRSGQRYVNPLLLQCSELK
jgi:hypothetical protein